MYLKILKDDRSGKVKTKLANLTFLDYYIYIRSGIVKVKDGQKPNKR